MNDPVDKLFSAEPAGRAEPAKTPGFQNLAGYFFALISLKSILNTSISWQ